jgi:CHAT domain-containing protein
MNRFYVILLLLLTVLPWKTSCQHHPQSGLTLKSPEKVESFMQIERWRFNRIQQASDAKPFQLNETYDLKKIQQTLIRYRPHVAVLSYYVQNEVIHVHFIHRDTFYYQAIPFPETLNQDIQTLNDQIDGKSTDNYPTYAQASERIYKTLIAPIAELGNGFEWFIIPDSTIEQLNFGALIVPPAPTIFPPESRGWVQATFLADDVTISYGLSMLLVLEILSRPEQTNATYFVSDSASAFARFFQQNQLVPVQDTVPPMISHIKTAQALPPKGNLVTIENTVENITLTYANAYQRGVKTMLLSTAIPSEQTYESLIYDFYCYYLEMRSVPYAFRSAQQNFIGHPDYSAPKYWAKYKVWGL